MSHAEANRMAKCTQSPTDSGLVWIRPWTTFAWICSCLKSACEVFGWSPQMMTGPGKGNVSQATEFDCLGTDTVARHGNSYQDRFSQNSRHLSGNIFPQAKGFQPNVSSVTEEDELKGSSTTHADMFGLSTSGRAHKSLYREEGNDSTKWVLDTGAAFHVTYDPSWLHCYQHRASCMCVSLKGSGSVQTKLFKLSDVHYIPGMTLNIISVGMLIKSGYNLCFTPEHCYVRDVMTGRIVGEGSRSRGTYVLDYLIVDQGRNWRPQDELRGIRPYSHATLPTDPFTEEDGEDDELKDSTDRKPEMFGQGRDLELDVNPSSWYRTCEALVASTVNQQPANLFLVDSGAYYHITKDRSLLQLYPAHLNVRSPIKYVTGVSGAVLAVTEVGYIDCPEVRLDGVLCIPGAVANLVSVGQILSQYPTMQVLFTFKEGVTFKEPSSSMRGRIRKIIGKARMEGNLFVLENLRPGLKYVKNLICSVEESSGTSSELDSPMPMEE